MDADTHPVNSIVDDDNNIRNIPLDLLDANPDQPRKIFDEEELAGLTQSIKDHGVLAPVLVRRNGDRYIIIAGERRTRASRAAGLAKIPALVRTKDDPEELSLIENLQRVNLDPLEEAFGMASLKKDRRYTDEQVARVLGKSRRSVSESVSLLDLPEPVLAGWRTSAKLTKSQYLQILRERDSDAQIALWEAFKNGQMTIRQARTATAQKNNRKPGPKPFTFPYKAPDKTFVVTVRFRKSQAGRDEITAALQQAIDHAVKSLT